MKIAVIGPGALGCLLAASVARSKRDEVWLLDHDEARAAKTGPYLFLEEKGETTECAVRVTCDPERIGRADVVFLCVKSKDVTSAFESARQLFVKPSLLVAFQNGIGHLQALANIAGHVAVAIGITAQGSTLLGPGHVKHAGAGPTRMGMLPGVVFPQNTIDMLQRCAAILSEAGVVTEVVPDIMKYVWNKLLINVGINGLTALYDCPNGSLLDNSEALERLERLVSEAAGVAAARGVVMEYDPVAAAIEVCHATADNISSMLQDVRKRRLTEIDAINGAIVSEASLLGLAVPENDKLVRQIKEIENRYFHKSS